MTSPEKWICDGISKNPKYTGSDPHEPHENYAPDCELCGLPRESSIKPPTSLPIKPILIAIAGLLVIGGSGAAYTLMAKGCEAGLEEVAGQCVDPFLQPYQQATQQGDEAILLAKDYKSIIDLEKAHLSLGDAIKQLDLIPTEASIYVKVGTKITEYKKEKADIGSNLGSEKIAAAKLQSSTKTAEEAKSKTSGNRTVAELKSAKEKWIKAQSTLQEIDFSNLVMAQAKQNIDDYDREIKGIDSRIAAMIRRSAPKPVRSTYRAPKKTYKPVRKQKYYPPKRKTKRVNSSSCAENKSSNCLF